MTFNSPKASDVFGSEQNAEALVRLWEDGADFYSGLSTDSETVTAGDSFAAVNVVWQRPDVVIDVIGDMERRLSGR